MGYTAWVPGTEILPPVYLDAGVLVAAFATNDARYRKASTLLGELLAMEAPILLSELTLTESLWMLARLSYCEMNNQRPNAQWSSKIYRTHRAAIFEKHGKRMTAIYQMVQDWTE